MADYDRVHDFLEDLSAHEPNWAERATAFVAIKKRASAELMPEARSGLSNHAVTLMAHTLAEKLAFQTKVAELGFEDLAEREMRHVNYFARQLTGYDWELPEISATKLASMRERGVVLMSHLAEALGDSPARATVESFMEQDQAQLPKLAAHDSSSEGKTKKASAEVVAKIAKLKQAVSAKWVGERVAGGMKQRFGHLPGYKKMVQGGGATAEGYSHYVGAGAQEAKDQAVSRLRGTVPKRFQSKAMEEAAGAKAKAQEMRRNLDQVTGSAGEAFGGKERIRVGTVPKRVNTYSQEPVSARTGELLKKSDLEKQAASKVSALKVASLIKRANEAGMGLDEYLAAEQQAMQAQEANELQHTRQIAEQATQENQQLAERATMAEQQLMQLQQQSQMMQMQSQQAMQAAADAEANAAEQANAKLRMKMKIDQMRQALADIAAVNPQMDEVGPEPGMPQPGAPPGPVEQQQAAAQQMAAIPPTDAKSAKEQQQAATAQQEAQQQTQQAMQQKQQDASKIMAAQMPANAAAAGAPAVAPAAPGM